MNTESVPPRRVLFVENGIGYGGAVICLRHLVRHLDRSRYTPLVVTGRTGPEYEGIASDAEWRHIPDRRVDVVRMRERLAAATWPDRVPGLRFVLNQCVARLDDVANLVPFLACLMWTAWRTGPEIIHANNEPLCNRAALLAGKLLGIPVVCHVRGDQRGSAAMRWLYRIPDRFIPVSEWISRGVGALGVPPAHRAVVYDGIALERLALDADGREFRRRAGISESAFAVGLVGLLIPWKGQHLFLDAAHILNDRIPNLKLLIVGGTPADCVQYEAELRQRVAAEGLEDLVVFTGHQSTMDAVYNGLDVAVSASTSPEPLGTMVIETMALGRPLVAPNHGGAAEMAEHELTALLFEPRNAASLAHCIERFHREPELRERLGKAARAKALRTFSIEQHVANVQAVYEDLLAKPQATPARSVP